MNKDYKREYVEETGKTWYDAYRTPVSGTNEYVSWLEKKLDEDEKKTFPTLSLALQNVEEEVREI